MPDVGRNRVLLVASAVVWFSFVAMRMRASMEQDPGATGLLGDLPNLHNRPGDLRQFILMSGVELCLVLLLLRPWSYRRSWGRALTALVLLAPWTFLFLAMAVHSGGVMIWHLKWLGGVLVGLLVLFVISSGSAWMHQRQVRVSEPPNER